MTASDKTQQPPAARRPHPSQGVALPALGSVVVGAVVSWWICVVQRVPVRSDAELGAVRFGLPLPWVTQDYSANPAASYPTDFRMLRTGKGAWTVPTDYDWGAFAANSLLWGAAAWAVGAIAVALILRRRRSRHGRSGPGSAGRAPDAHDTAGR